MNPKILFIIMLLLFTVTVTAEYPYTGYASYSMDDGIFNSENAPTLTGNRILSDASYMPLSSDLDSDGTNEVIVYDSGYIKVYDGDYTLTPKYTIALNDVTSEYGMPYIYDIDSDGYPNILIGEIVNFASETFTIMSYQYNGSIVTYHKNWTQVDGALAVYTGNWFPVIGCQDSECLVVLNNNEGIHGTQASADGMVAIAFDNDSISSPIGIRDIYGIGGGTTAYGILCLPDIPDIQAKNGYYSFSFFEYRQSGVPLVKTEELVIYKIEINASGDPVVIDSLDWGNIYSGLNAFSGSCDDIVVPVSSVLVDPDIYNSLSGNEYLLSYKVDSDQFRGKVYDENLNELRTLGDGFCDEGQGTLLGNPIIGNIYEDTGSVDFCITGFNNSDFNMMILCDSFDTSYSSLFCSETGLYIRDYPDTYPSDISYILGDITPIYNNAVHVTEQDSSVYGNEFMTPFGVLSLDFDLCSGGACQLTFERIFTDIDSAKILSDLSDDLSDVLLLDDEYIQYWDDGYSNTGGFISEVIMNPCGLSSVIKINSTVGISLRCNDSDGDNVETRAWIYYGSIYEQLSNWTTNHSQGILDTHIFTANATGTAYTVRVECRDIENPSEIDSEERLFSVANEGVEYGDCQSDWSIIPEAEEEADSGTVTESDNIILDAFDTMESEFNIPSLLIFILVLVIIIYNIWVSPITETNPQITFGIIFIVTALMLIFGVKLGIISFGFLATLVILSIVPIGIWIGKKFMGHTG